nr:MAG TPA: hypothetical protein [Caudoviricetes sp.]
MLNINEKFTQILKEYLLAQKTGHPSFSRLLMQ